MVLREGTASAVPQDTAKIRALAPEGRPSLAQRFSAGILWSSDASPGGTAQAAATNAGRRTRIHRLISQPLWNERLGG